MMATIVSNPGKHDPNLNLNSCAVEELSIHQKFKKVDDITTLIDQPKKKLSSLDSQRIVSVIDEVILKCEIVTLLPYIVDNLERFSIMLGSDLINAIQEYDHQQILYSKSSSRLRKFKLSQDATTLLSSRDTVRSQVNILISKDIDDHNSLNKCSFDKNESYLEQEGYVDYDVIEKSCRTHAFELSSIIKVILRLFRINPGTLAAIKNERKERPFEANNFIDNLTSLRDLVFGRLLTTPGEEREKQRTTVQVMLREKKAQSLIKKLETDLKGARNEKEKIIHEKNEEIQKLKINIQTIEQDSDLINRKILSDAQKFENAEIKNEEGKKMKLQQELIQLKQQCHAVTTKHRESELALRRRKFKIETEVENWIQKYDADMTERQDELDELSEIYAEEKKQLEDLQKRFDILEKDYNEIIEERRLAQQKKEEVEAELRNMVKAATLLQSFWRAYKCRKALKAKQKKGKKGKGGKKKK